jgi:hypothetical protein
MRARIESTNHVVTDDGRLAVLLAAAGWQAPDTKTPC